MDTETFDERLPASDYATFDEWRAASQRMQANLLRYQIEALRRLKYRPAGGFCLSMLADAQPAVSFSIFDHNRLPKSAYRAVRAACAPMIITADRLSPTYRPGERVRLAVHAVSDMRRSVERATVEAVIRYPGGEQRWRFRGEVPADSCVLIGKPSFELPPGTEAGRVVVELALGWSGGRASNRYLASVVT
jgi:beta-mannosidase